MSDAVGYTRLSQESDASIDRQKRHIREYADEHGYLVDTIYDDGQHSSGFDDDREEYQLLRERVQSGDVDAVIVNSKRRLARDFDETMRLILDFREHDIEVHTYEGGLMDVSDPVQAAIEVLQAASEHEAKKKEIERAREAVDERLNQGFDHGRPPFGLEFDDDGEYWVPSEDYGTVMDVFDMLQTAKPYTAIESETGVSRSSVSRIKQRGREFYEKRALGKQN